MICKFFCEFDPFRLNLNVDDEATYLKALQRRGSPLVAKAV